MIDWLFFTFWCSARNPEFIARPPAPTPWAETSHPALLPCCALCRHPRLGRGLLSASRERHDTVGRSVPAGKEAFGVGNVGRHNNVGKNGAPRPLSHHWG